MLDAIRVNILRQIKTSTGWHNKPLERDDKGRLRWPSNTRFLIEWRDSGRRLWEAAGLTPSEALEAQKRKRLELDAKDTGLVVTDPEEEAKLPLRDAVETFLKDVKTFRKLYTWKKYRHVLELFEEYVAPKSDLREIMPEDVKAFLAWRKAKASIPAPPSIPTASSCTISSTARRSTTRSNEVPRLTKFRKRPSAYTDADLKKFFAACNEWERAFFSVALATGLRRGELQTLHWRDIDLARRRIHVTAKPEYGFLPKDWEERTVPLTKEVAALLKKHPAKENCPVVFRSPQNGGNKICSPSFLHDLCKAVAKRAGLNQAEWHLHRFRDTAATR